MLIVEKFSSTQKRKNYYTRRHYHRIRFTEFKYDWADLRLQDECQTLIIHHSLDTYHTVFIMYTDSIQFLTRCIYTNRVYSR